jgi:alcohol dehydrogenase/S-(hydroxymethyl)glutathione dehydrogenase/alcohol dehydrogenase
MRAAVLQAVGQPLQVLDDVEIDDPRPGEVLVRVRHCGVCQSDLAILDGKMPYPLPVVLGHEASGTVAALGPGVGDLAIGQPVVLSMKPPCGGCGPCLNGQPVLCDRAPSPSVLPEDPPRLRHRGRPVVRGLRLGAFAEYVLLERSGVVPLPDGLPLAQAALVGCAVQTGLGSVLNVAEVHAGQAVAVIGLGAVGLSVVRALRLAGARHIVGIEPHAWRREQARLAGADAVLDPLTAEAEATLATLAGAGFDHVFDAVCSEHTVAQAARRLRKGGTLTLIGVAPPGKPLPVPMLDVVMRQLTLKGSFLGNSHPQRDLPRYLDLCCRGRFDLASMVTAQRPLAEVNEAFDELRRGEGLRTVLTI